MNDALRVLMVADVSPSRPLGGGERMLWEQARHLAARGHDVRVVSRTDPGATAPVSVEREGVRIRQFPVEQGSVARFIRSSILAARRATADELASEPVDVLHVHQPLAGYGALASRAGGRLPSLYSFYSPAPLEYRSRRGMTARHLPGVIGATGVAMLWTIERACLRRASLIHVLSDFSAYQLWKLYAVPRERIVTIRGAVATERFRPGADRGRVRECLGLPPQRPLLLTIRNLEARMGLDNLLDAMAIVRRGRPDALLLIGGAGSLRGILEDRARALGLADHVKFLGFVPDETLPSYYQAADVFVLPTRELEGFGLVTVEALACGTPVLGTPVGATPEVLKGLDASLVFRGTSAEIMAEGLLRFLETMAGAPDGYERLRCACRAHAERHYTWERATTGLERALGRVAAHGHVDARGRRAAALRGRDGSAAPPECPACGEPTRPSALLYRGARHRQCEGCGTSLAAELPSALDLQCHYETEYPLRFAPESVTSERAGLFRALLDRLAALGLGRAERPRLLDVGAGGGHLAALARFRRWPAVSTDIAGRACAVAGRDGGAPAVQADGALLPFRDGTIDAVTLINVLDQARDPLTILREAHRVLVAGGLVALRVPNASFHRPWVRLLASLGPLVRSREWDTCPIVHHFAFTPIGLRRLVERAGFRVLEVGNSLPAFRAHPVEPHAVATLSRWAQTAITAGAAALAGLSRHRVLIGPSVELYAMKGPA
ncbi:MAG: hypothetical protein DME04_00675 [Candidatus Rokuibacteriota bacterium]|nr:MAG: hypothetical protein DME04_00675 [Candidatus Rokubacteria bacterium]